MPDKNEKHTQLPRVIVVRRTSGFLVLIVMAIGSWMYIPHDDPGGGEILLGLFIGSCMGSGVLALGWVVVYALGRITDHAHQEGPEVAIGTLTPSSVNSAPEATEMPTGSSHDLTPQEQDELNLLIERVPFTSLPWIVSLMVACGFVSLSGVVFLILNNSLSPALKHFVIYAVLILGFGAFGFWSALPRRSQYRERFEAMLARNPIVVWKYTDEEWEAWLEFSERLAFGRTRNTTPWKVAFMVICCSLVGGTLLYLMRSDTSFFEAFGVCVGLMSLPVPLYYLYWKHLRQDWERSPTEARMFQKAVFFHHKFVDWEENPDEGVLVEVETEDQPIATLSVRMRKGGAKLAPHLKDLSIPVPQDRIGEARQLARSLCQNVNLDEGDSETLAEKNSP